jgi:TPR repeat protein
MKMRTAVLIACVLGCLSPHGAALAADARDDVPGTVPKALISPPRASSPDVDRAAKRGDALAQYDLGVTPDRGRGVRRDPDGALEWLRKAVEQGHVNAQCALS